MAQHIYHQATHEFDLQNTSGERKDSHKSSDLCMYSVADVGT